MKKLLFTILILSFTLSYSQTTDITTTGYYKVWFNDVFQTNHTAERKAAAKALTLQLQYPSADVYYTFPEKSRVVLSGVEEVPDQLVIDTVITTGYIHLLDWTIDPTKALTYIKTPTFGIIPIEEDTIRTWQTIFKLQRNQTFGKTEYTEITPIPFQLMHMTGAQNSLGHILKVDATEYCKAYFKVVRQDTMEESWTELHDDFQLKDHEFQVRDLQDSTTYKLYGTVENANGEIRGTTGITMRVEARPKDGFQYHTALTLESTIDSTSAKVRTLTTENCNIQLKIGTDPFNLVAYDTDTGFNASNVSERVWRHSRLLENLAPNTKYYWQATNVDANGINITSMVHSFTTKN